MRCGFCGLRLGGNWANEKHFCWSCNVGYINCILAYFAGKENKWTPIPKGCLVLCERYTEEIK
jgi:hypothetical protein